MSTRVVGQTKPAPVASPVPAHRGVLQRACACGGTPGPTGECAECRRKKRLGVGGLPLQPKLRVNQPGDRFEQEADRVAEQVMRMPAPDLQRQVDEEEEEELLQTKPLVQRQITGGRDGGEAPPIVHKVLQSPGRPLDPATRAFFEPRFGHDFSQVRVHTDARAAESARAVNALAYTVGKDMVFGAGQYAPKTEVGQRLLAHELVHVMQQANGFEPHLQRTMAECEVLMAQSTPASLISGTVVHSLIQADFARMPGALSMMIPGASAAPLRSQGLCGEDSTIIKPQIIGGRAGAGFPDLALLTPGGILQVAEIKPASWGCLVDGEEQLRRYIDQGNASDPAQAAWRSAAGISVVVPMPESAYSPPSLTTPNFNIRTAWCMPGLLVYSVTSRRRRRRVPAPIPEPVPAPTPESPLERISRFIQEVIESGEDVTEAARRFLQQNPELINFLIGAAVGVIVATIIEDIVTAGVGIVDDFVIIPVAVQLIRVAQSMRAAAPALAPAFAL